MKVRIDDFIEEAIGERDAPSFMLDKLHWVGHGGHQNWCWAACAVMIELFNENAVPGTEQEVMERLCRVANKILGTDVRKCCQSDPCDELLDIDHINELWKRILNQPAKHKPAPFETMQDEMVTELQVNRRGIEIDMSRDALIGHAVIVYGFGGNEQRRFFHVHDPALDPSFIRGGIRMIPGSVLEEQSKNIWFDLKPR
jgi:hypothetical protein